MISRRKVKAFIYLTGFVEQVDYKYLYFWESSNKKVFSIRKKIF